MWVWRNTPRTPLPTPTAPHAPTPPRDFSSPVLGVTMGLKFRGGVGEGGAGGVGGGGRGGVVGAVVAVEVVVACVCV